MRIHQRGMCQQQLLCLAMLKIFLLQCKACCTQAVANFLGVCTACIKEAV